MRKQITVYDAPEPAKVVLARAMGTSIEQADKIMKALFESGYGIAPREPTNSMLCAYLTTTTPPSHHESVMTAIGKARKRWQAMLDSGCAMAMSLKHIPDDLIQSPEVSPQPTLVDCPICKGPITHISAIGPACLDKECPVSDDANLWRDRGASLIKK